MELTIDIRELKQGFFAKLHQMLEINEENVAPGDMVEHLLERIQSGTVQIVSPF